MHYICTLYKLESREFVDALLESERIGDGGRKFRNTVHLGSIRKVHKVDTLLESMQYKVCRTVER